jgi:hypothetical protein
VPVAARTHAPCLALGDSWASQLRHVLGVIVDREELVERTLAVAIGLADNGRARLSLVKTCDTGVVFASFGPLGAHATVAPPDLCARETAGRMLGRLVQDVPGYIPVCTVVLGARTQDGLRRLLRGGAYDALVAPADLVATCPRLARDAASANTRIVTVTSAARQ